MSHIWHPPIQATDRNVKRMWIERIAEATRWEPTRLGVSWNGVEEELGTPLPEDYKKLVDTFGKGEFSEFLRILTVDATRQFDLVRIWKKFLHGRPESGPDPAFKPYRIYQPDQRGLIPWAFGEMKCSYFWLASAEEDPKDWPIVTQGDPYTWQEVSLSTGEFVYRVLADPEFEPFSIARLMPEPEFHSMD
ncbi:SMI1/KNR4 family protein [Streptomyces sp. NPDC005791]|uniref:SMI1/KNR4 family protein n=1 Tax=Streptomyces sp. NPDC005791 TaxID=3364732 RepID=UPI0036A3A4CC